MELQKQRIQISKILQTNTHSMITDHRSLLTTPKFFYMQKLGQSFLLFHIIADLEAGLFLFVSIRSIVSKMNK